jgi:hypothetical protein
MSNDEIIFNLRERIKRLDALELIQKNFEARVLIAAERDYVDALLRYRETHGGMTGVILQ